MGLIDKVNVEVNGSGDLLSTLSTYTTKILKPNIVDGKNVLTQTMISSKNTKYVIKYDYELTEDVTIPANCVLEFDGGSLSGGTLIGNNTCIKAGTVKIFDTNIILLGTWNIKAIDIRWFGVIPDDNTIDCTPILEKISSLQTDIFFPAGNFYLSEFHFTNRYEQTLGIVGVQGDALKPRTTFNPFTSSQYYIIKIGGAKYALGCLSDDVGYNVKIQNIRFTTPSGYTPKQLTNNYNSTATYNHAALVLDTVQCGQFALNFSGVHNTAGILMGFIYECHFDYIVCYGNHGKSDLPVIQVTNNASTPITATIIDRLMVEVIVGSIVSMSSNGHINEMIINNITVEGTIKWERESITSEERYSERIDISNYHIVPLFDLKSNSSILIGLMSITESNIKWKNSLDSYSETNIRGLITLDNALTNLWFETLKDNGFSSFVYISGFTRTTYQSNISFNKTNTFIQSVASGSLQIAANQNNIATEDTITRLVTNKKYVGQELSDIAYPYYVSNVGSNNLIRMSGNSATIFELHGPRYMINQNGIKINTDADCIVLKCKTATDSDFNITIEYYNEDTLVTTTSAPCKTRINENSGIATFVLPIEKSITFTHLKLVWGINGYGTDIFEVGAYDAKNIPIAKRGTIRPINNQVVSGFEFFDTTLSKPIWWNGSAWVDEKGFTATATKGTTRPTGTGGGGVLDATRDIGFEFFDTNPSVMKPIYARAIANDGTVTWVDATSTTV